MKIFSFLNIITILCLLMLTAQVSAQAPDSFTYQAIVRDSLGNISVNNQVSLKISLLKGDINSDAVYTEIQNDSTNQFGLITLEVGTGIVETGNFSNINWGSDKIFVKIEIDITGGSDYEFMGATQLISVPYALHSKSSEQVLIFSDEVRDTMTNVPMGTIFFNTTTNNINYYQGTRWYEINGICLPQPTQPNAGFDQIFISGATAIMNANTPESGTGYWSIKSGTGGTIEDSLNPITLFSGLPGNTYTLSWTIQNGCGSLTDEVTVNFAPFVCGASFKDDRDNKVYSTVLIGSQCWMAQNINIGTKIDGDISMANDGIFEKYCQGNIENNCNTYGGLYQWNEMMQFVTNPGTQGICPSGWHIPTDTEWKTLEGTADSQYGVGNPVWDQEGDRGFDAGGKLKEAGLVHWTFPNTGATNESGFTALPGGARNTDGTFPSFQISGRFWTSSDTGSNAYRRILSTATMDIARNAANKNFGLSVRCIKD